MDVIKLPDPRTHLSGFLTVLALYWEGVERMEFRRCRFVDIAGYEYFYWGFEQRVTEQRWTHYEMFTP